MKPLKIPKFLKVIVVIAVLAVGVPTGCKYLNPKRQAAVAQAYDVAMQLGYTSADYVTDFDKVHDFTYHNYVFVFLTNDDLATVDAKLKQIGDYGRGSGSWLDLISSLGDKVTFDGQSVNTIDEQLADLPHKKVKQFRSTDWVSNSGFPAISLYELSKSNQDVIYSSKKLNRNVVVIIQMY